MFKCFRFIKNIVLLNKRLAEEKEQQKKQGYSIELEHAGAEQHIVYRQGNREVTAGASFTGLNDVRLYTNSFVRWDKPRGEELTPFDYKIVLNRLIRFLSCWGGEVILDNTQIQDLEQLKESLRQEGVAFKEVDGVIMYESTVADEKIRRNTS